MKFAIALTSLFLLSNNTFAQEFNAEKPARVFSHPLGASPGEQLIITTLVNDENIVASQEAEYSENLFELEEQIASLQSMNAETLERINRLKEERRIYRKKDGCINTLGFDTKEICAGPFSGDTPALKENYNRARQANAELASAKAASDALERRIRELDKKVKPLRKKKEELARRQAEEEARLKRAMDKRAQQDATGRAAEIKREEDLRRGQELLSERQERRHATDISDLRSKIKRSDVQSAMTDLKLQQSQMAEAIRIIEDEYDRSLMGAYMQRKFVALLESDLLCKKTAECQSGKKTKVSNEEILKLFPNAPATPKTSSSSGVSGAR